jgi:two-component system chemotaxis response regulator CheY
LRFLILDDLKMNGAMLSAALVRLGRSDAFQDADLALEAMRKAYTAQTPYDLMFLDLVMPKRHGLEVLSLIREMEGEIKPPRKTPVIMVSARGESQLVVEAAHRGASGYVLRPFRPERILKETERVLALPEGQGMQGMPAPVADDGGGNAEQAA